MTSFHPMIKKRQAVILGPQAWQVPHKSLNKLVLGLQRDLTRVRSCAPRKRPQYQKFLWVLSHEAKQSQLSVLRKLSLQIHALRRHLRPQYLLQGDQSRMKDLCNKKKQIDTVLNMKMRQRSMTEIMTLT